MLSYDTSIRKKIGLEGRQKMEKEYPLSIICERYYNLYSQISCGENNYEKI
jgi:glycosyltransferase involved in cell wall biosynthesis